MNIKIYQINQERDSNRARFLSFDELQKVQDIDASMYDNVFSGDIDETNLEGIYTKFNTDMHPLFRGHSLSVSDVVSMNGESYYCDSIGFKKIDFDESQTQKPSDLMRAVYVEPHRKPFETEIENSLKAEQQAVGGLIELVYNDDDTIIVCNDEGKLIGMDGNRHLDDGSSIIAGPFFIVGDGGEDFRSLTDEEVEKYLNRFAEIEDVSKNETLSDMGFEIYGISL